jgi:hypothetical protein
MEMQMVDYLGGAVDYKSYVRKIICRYEFGDFCVVLVCVKINNLIFLLSIRVK